MKRMGILWGLLTAIQFSLPPTTTAQPIPPTNGLVGWWRGENNGFDSSTNGLHGTLVSGVGFADGKFGKAFSFQGTANCVFIPDTEALRLTNSLSIAAWILPTANSWHVMERAANVYGSYTYSFGLDPSRLQFVIHNFAGPVVTIDAPITLHQWSHVACSLEGSTGDMRLYINGVTVAQTNTSIRPTGAMDPTWDAGVGIGNTARLGAWPFIGIIDEVLLYSRALSLTEINTLATNPPPTVSLGLFAGVAVNGIIGRTYAIQYATNVNALTWSNLATITLTQHTQLWVDEDANVASGTRPQRFYRAELVR